MAANLLGWQLTYWAEDHFLDKVHSGEGVQAGEVREIVDVYLKNKRI